MYIDLNTILWLMCIIVLGYLIIFNIKSDNEYKEKQRKDAIRRATPEFKAQQKESQARAEAKWQKKKALLKVAEKNSGKLMLNTKPLVVSDIEMTFEELGKSLILPSINGTYGLLFQNGLSVDGILSDKVKENEDLAQIFMSCLVSSSFFIYLVKKLNATNEEMKEFHNGLKIGYKDIQVNNKSYFNQQQIDHWISVIDYYTQQQISDLNTDPNSFRMGGSKSASAFISMVYDAFKINSDENNAEEIINRMLSELLIDTSSTSTISSLEEIIKRKNS